MIELLLKAIIPVAIVAWIIVTNERRIRKKRKHGTVTDGKKIKGVV